MKQRIYVTKKHIIEGDVCPHDCMVANALRDAGYPEAIIDGKHYYGSMEDEDGVLLSRSLRNIILYWDCEDNEREIEPFSFDILISNSCIIEFGEIINSSESSTGLDELINEIESYLEYEYNLGVNNDRERSKLNI